MHLSSQEEYGLRCLMRLARHEGPQPLRIQEIADGEGMSPEYVAKLMRILRNGSLVSSTRGAAGGYRLKRPAADVTVWAAVEVLGGEFFPDSFCQTHPGSLRDCVHSTDCSIRALWSGLNGLLRQALSGITLADLMRGDESTFGWLAHANLSELPAGTQLPVGYATPQLRTQNSDPDLES
jgi:Rrf2 family protein